MDAEKKNSVLKTIGKLTNCSSDPHIGKCQIRDEIGMNNEEFTDILKHLKDIGFIKVWTNLLDDFGAITLTARGVEYYLNLSNNSPNYSINSGS